MHKEDGNYALLKENFYRIILTRSPRINLYENIVSESELEILKHIEARTNSRIREDCQETKSIKDEEKYIGTNSFLVNSAFLYYSEKNPTRFSNGTYGAFYCAKEIDCAIEETKYHALKFAQATNEKTYESQRSVLAGKLEGKFCDIRNKNLVEIYSSYDYSQSQIFGSKTKNDSKDGIVYDSVRYKGGTCYAVFKPAVIKKIKEIKCLNYILKDGKIIIEEI